MAGRRKSQPEQDDEPAGPAAEVSALISRVESGDAAARPLLRRALLAIDDRAVLSQAVRGPDDWALRLTCESITGGDGSGKAWAAGLRRHATLLAEELAGRRPTAIEKILADRIALCWLVCAGADAWLATGRKGDVAANLRAFHEKTAARAERRLLAACQALATVRRKALPLLIGVPLPRGECPRQVVEPAEGLRSYSADDERPRDGRTGPGASRGAQGPLT